LFTKILEEKKVEKTEINKKRKKVA